MFPLWSALSQIRRRQTGLWTALCLGAALATLTSCTGPYSQARTVGTVGGVLAAVGGAAWVVGETTDAEVLLVPGVVGVLLGAAGILTSAVMVAAQSSCTADADCPLGHVCKELLQPAGRESFSQCVPR